MIDLNKLLLKGCVLTVSTVSFPVASSVLPIPIAVTVPLQQTSLDEPLLLMAINSRPTDPVEALTSISKARGIEMEACRVLWEHMLDYTFGGSLEGSIQNFLGSLLKGPCGPLECVDPKRMHLTESVFIAKDSDLVVKVFPQSDEHKIVRELSGMAALRNLQLHEGQVVEFLAMGSCTVDNQKSLLLAMKRIPGKEIKNYVDDLLASSNREASLSKCRRIFVQLGRVLAEMHSKRMIQVSQQPNPTFEDLKSKIETHLQKYRRLGGSDPERLKAFFENLIHQYDAETFFLCVFHGDAHLQNFIYDEFKDKITILDTARCHLSLDPQDRPLTAGYIHDVARLEDDIAKWILHKEYNEELIQELIMAVHEGYGQIAKDLLVPSQVALDRAYTLLTRWNSTLNWRNEENPETREQKQRIEERYRGFFFK